MSVADVLTDSSSTVQSGVTPETDRSVAGLSWSSSRATTQFDFSESLTEEVPVDVTVKVYISLLQVTSVIKTSTGLGSGSISVSSSSSSFSK